MKATKIFMSLLAIVVFAGCSTENIEENIQSPETFKVIASHIDADTASRMWVDGETRATINVDNQNVWEANDELAFLASGSTQCTLTATSVSEDGKTATFEGEGMRFPNSQTFYAAYPSSATIASNGVASFAIAASQDGSASSAMLLVGQGSRNAAAEIYMTFSPAAAILHVHTTVAMDRIVVSSCAGENIAGTYASDGTFAGSASAITVDPEGSANDFYIALPAGITLSKGYKISYYKDAGSSSQMLYSYNYSAGCTFEAATGYKVNFTRAWSPISVTLGARSSYTFYTEGNATAANACNAETIYLSTTTVNGVTLNCASSFSGVSSTLVEECGFVIGSTTIKGSYNSSTKTFSAANRTAQAWSTTAQSVKAYIKVGGETIYSAARSIYITGLPYIADGNNSLHKINTSGTYPWTNESSSSNIKWNDTSVKLEGYGWSTQSKYQPKAATPKFAIPADVNIQVKSSVSRNSGINGFAVYTYSTSNGTSTIYEEAASSHTIDVATAFSTSVNRIMYHSKYSANTVNIHTVSNVKILYR